MKFVNKQGYVIELNAKEYKEIFSSQDKPKKVGRPRKRGRPKKN